MTAGYAEATGPTRTEVRKAFTYDLLGRVTSDLERVSGIAHTYRYTADGYLERYEVEKPGGALDYLYAVSEFDLLGHPTGYTRTTGRDATGGADGCCSPNYGVDGHYRFRSDNLTGPFTYDVAGNRVRELTPRDVTPSSTFVSTYDLANRLVERVEEGDEGGRHYLHDRSGNRLGYYVFDASGPVRDNELLTYDAEHRLYVSVVEHVYLSGNWAHAWYFYDGLGRRTYAHEAGYVFWNTGVQEPDAPGVRKYYVWDGDDVLLKLERTTATGPLTARARYHLGPGVDDAVAATVTSTVGEVKTWYFVRDRLGSVLFLRDAAGGFESSGQVWQYDPWGNSTPGNPDGDTNNAGTEAGYTGAQVGEGSGFVYLRNRYYDPKTGRFLTEDPIGFAGGVNFYAYANNNPLAHTDPFGLCPPCVGLVDPAAGLGLPAPAAGGGGGLLLAGVLLAGAIALPVDGPALDAAALANFAVRAGRVARVATTAATPLLMESDQGRTQPVTVRLQAQGGGLQQSVVIQSGPSGLISGTDGLAGLAALQSSLSSKDRAARARSFQRAARFITNAAAAGGYGPGRMPFPARPGTDVRVDVEVLRGRAFRPGPRSDAIIR